MSVVVKTSRGVPQQANIGGDVAQHSGWIPFNRCNSPGRTGRLQNNHNSKTRAPKMQNNGRRDRAKPKNAKHAKSVLRTTCMFLRSWVWQSVPPASVLHLWDVCYWILVAMKSARVVCDDAHVKGKIGPSFSESGPLLLRLPSIRS